MGKLQPAGPSSNDEGALMVATLKLGGGVQVIAGVVLVVAYPHHAPEWAIFASLGAGTVGLGQLIDELYDWRGFIDRRLERASR